MTTLILWRHGTTDWNTELRVQGHTDVPLNTLGRDQAREAASLLAARSPALIITSDLRRASETAAPLAQLTNVPVRYDSRLRERDYGEWEGLTMTEIAEQFPEAHARKRAGDPELGHGIEPPADVMKRMGEALREAADAVPGGTVVLVTHGGAARYGMFDLLGWPPERLGAISVLANCHYTELRFDPGRSWLLHAHNKGWTSGLPGYE